MILKATMATVVCASLLFCGAAVRMQAQDAAKGAALLAEARKAVGGEDRLRTVKALDVRGDFKRAIGQTSIEGELQIRVELPDKLRRDEDLSPPGGGPAIIRTEVLNGTTVWEENSGRGGFFIGRFGRGDAGRGGDAGRAGRGGRAALDPAQIEEAQRRAWQTDLARFLLAWLLATDVGGSERTGPTSERPVAWVATAEAPEGKADVLEITPEAGPVMRLFLDQASHMPLMMTWQGAAPQLVIAGRRGRGGDEAARVPRLQDGQPATFQMTLGEYKPVNGIKLPHLITRGVNDMTIEEWTIDSYRINPTFRADVFTK